MTLHANQEWGRGRLHQLSLCSQHGIQLSCSSHGSITRGDGSRCGTLGSGSIRGLDVPLGAAFLPGGLCNCGTVVQVKETAHTITEVNVYICHMAETPSSNSKKSGAAFFHTFHVGRVVRLLNPLVPRARLSRVRVWPARLLQITRYSSKWLTY